MGAFRPGIFGPCIVAAVALISGCQALDATKADAVAFKPVVHAVRGKAAVLPLHAMTAVHSLRIEPELLVTSTTGSTEIDYAFMSPKPIKIGTPRPAKIAYNPVIGGSFPGNSPYICSPSGFGQRASCHPRSL
ncbi:hypothetical protein C1D09_008960 [Mesorhizobium intechi]|nr:hypothetical protein C1D09_008960 [Mesorhizobium intechi]